MLKFDAIKGNASRVFLCPSVLKAFLNTAVKVSCPGTSTDLLNEVGFGFALYQPLFGHQPSPAQPTGPS